MQFARQAGCEELWETYVVRPGWVMSDTAYGFLTWGLGSKYCIWADETAATMLDTVLNGSENQVLDNQTMALRGRQLLRRV